MSVNINSILCEDVRSEIGGTHTLVGVVSGSVETEYDEFNVEYTLFTTFVGLDPGNHICKFKIKTPERQEESGGYSIEIADEDAAALIVLKGLPFRAKKSGTFEIELKFDGERRWRKLLSLHVRVSSSPADEEASTQS